MCTVYSVCILYVSACVSSFACGVCSITIYPCLSSVSLCSIVCVCERVCVCVCVCNLSVSVSGTVLLVKQGWPQASGAAGALEGSYDLAMDAGSEGRQYQASAAAFRYTAGTPYKVPPGQSTGAPPPYSPSPNPYQTAMYPIRSAYPQQNLYAQGAYYTQPMYAAQPHVIHHTTVVQPNSIPSTLYPAPVQQPRSNGHMAMGMVAGTTMAMSAGTLLTTPQHATQHIGGHPVTLPTYRPQGTPGYSYVPPHW
uniref:Family with sequence similarity 168 member A n=1 Tax=Oncorhynchus tshawytscha TaxID=74940 RepID=A0AAZ3SI53_ONCTS